MGGMQVKQLKEILDEDEPSTPNTKKHNLHLTCDPRSPSCDIVRTPIQVDHTPVLLKDPRSPTEGILRTPITYTAEEPALEINQMLSSVEEPSHGINQTSTPKAKLEAELAYDPRSPSTDITRTPVLVKQAAEISKELEDIGQIPVTNDVKSQLATPNSRGEAKYRRLKHTMRLSQHTSDKFLDKCSKTTQSVQCAPPSGEISGRSPLRAISIMNDNQHENSPRKMLQNKQALKLGFLKQTPKRYEIFTDEKENVNTPH